MYRKKGHMESTNPIPTNAEIEAAAERLSPTWVHSAPRSPTPGARQIHLSLARGRSHTVAVEIKRSPRRLGRTR